MSKLRSPIESSLAASAIIAADWAAAASAGLGADARKSGDELAACPRYSRTFALRPGGG